MYVILSLLFGFCSCTRVGGLLHIENLVKNVRTFLSLIALSCIFKVVLEEEYREGRRVSLNVHELFRLRTYIANREAKILHNRATLENISEKERRRRSELYRALSDDSV